MSKEYSDFGTWIRECRKSRKWTQSQLAQKTFCSVETIRKIEQNRIQYRPSEEMIEKLAHILEIPHEECSYFQTLGRRQNKTAEVSTPISIQPKRLGLGRNKWILWGGLIIIFLGIGWSVENHQKLYSCVVRALNKGTVNKQFVVDARRGWQDTEICILAGDAIEISQVSGFWTGDINSDLWTDAKGDPNSRAKWLDLTQANSGELIGKVGPRQKFRIGLGTKITARNLEPLSLRMNDASCEDCLADNEGQISVVITVTGSFFLH